MGVIFLLLIPIPALIMWIIPEDVLVLILGSSICGNEILFYFIFNFDHIKYSLFDFS